MGDILQTPQFQMRRLKKQLADERNNRDELELELAENRKLLTEKGRYLARWRMCVDGQHSGFSSGKVLGLSEVWPFCLLCCLLCWPGSRAPPWAHWLTPGSWCYPCPPPSYPGPAAPFLLPPRSSPHPGLSPLLSSGADAQIAMMQQRIDRLAQLNEKQAASPLEPRELEELRGKNERYGSPAVLLRPAQRPCALSSLAPSLAASLCGCMKL